MHVKTLREAWQPLEDFRTSYDGRKYGIPYLGMNKNFKRLAMRVNNHTAVTLLFGYHCKATGSFAKKTIGRYAGYSYEGECTDHIWRARLWLPVDNKTKMLFFYDDKAKFAQLNPATLLSSAFVSGDGKRALLVVSNLDREKTTGATARIDLEKLGFPASANVKVEDAVLDRPVEMKNATIKLDIEPERFRLLKLWCDQ